MHSNASSCRCILCTISSRYCSHDAVIIQSKVALVNFTRYKAGSTLYSQAVGSYVSRLTAHLVDLPVVRLLCRCRQRDHIERSLSVVLTRTGLLSQKFILLVPAFWLCFFHANRRKYAGKNNNSRGCCRDEGVVDVSSRLVCEGH